MSVDTTPPPSSPSSSSKAADGGPQPRSVWSQARDRVEVILPLAALIILTIYFSVRSDVFFTGANGLNILRQSAVLLVVALAGTFAVLIGGIDLSVGAMVTFTGIAAVMWSNDMGGIGALLALACAAAFGAANGVLNAYVKLPSFLVTLGTMFIIGGIASIMSDGRPQSLGASTLTSIVGGRIFGVPVIAVWAVLVLLLCIALVHGTVFGSYLYAIGDGERVAGMTGVPVKKIKVATFAISGLLAGFGGILLAVRTSSGAPGMGDSFLLDSIAAIVMGGTSLTGGVGGPRRTVLGVLVIVVLANGMTLTNVDPFYQVVIRGAVVIGAVALTIKRSELDLVK